MRCTSSNPGTHGIELKTGWLKWISTGPDTKPHQPQPELLLPTLHKTCFSFPHFQVCLREEQDHRQTWGRESNTFYFVPVPTLVKTRTQPLLQNTAENPLIHALPTHSRWSDLLLLCPELGKLPGSMYKPVSDTSPAFLVQTEILELTTVSLQPSGDTLKGNVKISIFISKRH